MDRGIRMTKNFVRGNTTFVLSDENPNANTNPKDHAILWVNAKTGEGFCPVSIEPDNNLWRGWHGSVRPLHSFLETLDIFGDNSCIFYLPLNGNLNDIGGMYNYTFYPVESERYGAGRWGQALDIIDSSSYLSIHGSMDLSFTDNFSFSFWIKGVPDRDNGSNVLFRSANATNVPVNLFWLYGDKIKMTTDGVDYVVSSIAIDRTKWTHIVVNIDKATNTQKLYFDGVVVAETNSTDITAIVRLDYSVSMKTLDFLIAPYQTMKSLY